MANFQDILNKPAAEVEPPKALPTGTYLCLVDGAPEIAQRGKNNNYCAIFKLKPVQAQADVDQQSLAETLNGSSLSEKKINHTLWITDDALWRLDQFLAEHLGIPKGTKTVGEMIPEAPGKQVVVTLGHRASDDGKQVYAEVKGTAHI